jgi:rhodanese-related sulfurtransferase
VVKTITPQQAIELLSNGGVDLIDVREPHEWITGHIPGSRLVPLARFRANVRAELGAPALIFVCAAGVRSEAAARLAAAQGATQVYNLSGGTRGWTRAGLPLETEQTVTAAE